MKHVVNLSDARAISLLLASRASITDSDGEKNFAPFLAELLRGIPYFSAHPSDLALLPIADDPRLRSNVAAFVRGSGSACLVLTGHYDVVDIAAYGALRHAAFDPEALAAAMLQGAPSKDSSANDNPADALVRADIASGEFLPGRGLLDMKSGLAAGIVTLARFAARPEKQGNILFLAVADEEGRSRGMRAAALALRPFLQERGCEPAAVFNLDATVDQEEGEAGRAIFLGSVGKLLPFALFVGQSAHAGAPFDGINPVLPAAEFVRMVESNPEALGERLYKAADGVPPPPTVLYLRETRTTYDVSMPRTVFCALNVLSHERGPAEVFTRMSELVLTAMEKSISLVRERASEQSRRGLVRMSPPDRPLHILDFSELIQRAEKKSPGILAAVRAQERDAEDLVAAACSIVNALAAAALGEGPCAVVGFAPPYYPCARIDKTRDAAFLAMLREETARFSAATGSSVKLRHYFPGISDMSFLSASDGPGLADYVQARSPLVLPPLPEALGCPVINVGPWGRDYHQATERVHAHYAFVELPELLWRLSSAVLGLHRDEFV